MGNRSQDVQCEQTSISERSSGDGGSEKEGHYTMSDEGGSATEEIYATISRRKRSKYSTGQIEYSSEKANPVVDKELEKGDVNCEVSETENEMCEDSVILGVRECDGEEFEEYMEKDKERREKARKVSSCSTFSNETFEELSQTFPANFANLRKQYKDIPREDEDQDNTNTADTNNQTRARILKPSHIRHLVLNNQLD